MKQPPPWRRRAAGIDPKRRFTAINCRIARVLFDHLVGDGQHSRLHLHTERSRSLKVDSEHKFGRLHDRHPSAATKRASGRSRARVAKAASNSPIVLALRLRICSPIVEAACCTSRKVFSALEALAGLTSRAIRTALGTKSCRSRSRLATTSAAKKLIPVALPAGRASWRPDQA